MNLKIFRLVPLLVAAAVEVVEAVGDSEITEAEVKDLGDLLYTRLTDIYGETAVSLLTCQTLSWGVLLLVADLGGMEEVGIRVAVEESMEAGVQDDAGALGRLLPRFVRRMPSIAAPFEKK